MYLPAELFLRLLPAAALLIVPCCLPLACWRAFLVCSVNLVEQLFQWICTCVNDKCFKDFTLSSLLALAVCQTLDPERFPWNFGGVSPLYFSFRCVKSSVILLLGSEYAIFFFFFNLWKLMWPFLCPKRNFTFRNFIKMGLWRIASSLCCQLFSSAAQSCPTLCDPMDCSTQDFPVHHQLWEFAQTHVHRVGDASQPSHPLLSPSPPSFNLSQHQRLFQ